MTGKMECHSVIPLRLIDKRAVRTQKQALLGRCILKNTRPRGRGHLAVLALLGISQNETPSSEALAVPRLPLGPFSLPHTLVVCPWALHGRGVSKGTHQSRDSIKQLAFS
jgi:hypothetical protein